MTKQHEENLTEFIGKGYASSSVTPPTGVKVKVITAKYDCFVGTYEESEATDGVNIFQHEEGRINISEILAWKHITQQ